MIGMEKICKSKDTHLNNICKMVNAIAFPLTIYHCESWTMKKRLDDFGLCLLEILIPNRMTFRSD